MDFHGFELDRFQEDAMASIEKRRSVVVAAPTGCGKTVIAEYAIEQALKENKRVFYTGPIKTLSNQKYRDFTERWGHEKVGIVTGDVSINPHANLVIMTTEIFRNSIFDGRGGNLDEVQWVIFDEVHYLGDEDRGTVWEESIIFSPPQIRFVCLSATVPNAESFTDWLEEIRQQPVDYVLEEKRPVPLKSYLFLGQTPFSVPELKGLQQQVQRFRRRGAYDKNRDAHGLISWLQKQKRLPCLYFCFNRRECEEKSKLFLKFKFVTTKESQLLIEKFDELVSFHQLDVNVSTVSLMRDLISRGIAFHHAGLLPALKDIVEQLFTTGNVRLLIATETFALGVNMPASSVAFDGLKKFNGVQVNWLLSREFTQMAGRAGRRGLDKLGTVVSLLEPRDHDPRALKRLLTGPVEPLVSSFNLSYSSICNLIERVGSRIHETLEKSFALFGTERPAARRRLKAKMKRTLEGKLRILEERKYIEDFRCTQKGHVAGQLNGFEVMGCELYFNGIFQELSDEEIAILFMAAVFEGRRREWYKQPDWDYLDDRFEKVSELVESWAELEVSSGLAPIKDLDFRLTEAVSHWYRGGHFSDFEKVTSASEGDVVRSFLLCCQFLRQMSHVVEEEELSNRLKSIRNRLFRDIMDAENQLKRVCAHGDDASVVK